MGELVQIIWDVDPILVHWGLNGGIRWYGVLWAVGIYLGFLIEQKMYAHENCPKEWADKMFVWMTLGAILGARIGHCLFYEWHLTNDPIQIFAWTIQYRNPYIEHPLEMIKIWEGGLASHGGAIGLIIAAWGLNRKHFSKDKRFQTSLIWVLDRLVVGVCITGLLIRLGNLMNSEIYGGPTSLPWGFVFVRDGQTEPCHPTQIYEMMYCLVAFVVTWVMYWRGKAYRREGLLLGTFLIIVFASRFGLEFIKNNQEAFETGLLLNMGQWLSLPFILWGIYLVVRSFRRPLLPEVTA